jgi:hypothetical protein
MVFNNLFTKYAKKALNKIIIEFATNIASTFLWFITINDPIDIKLITNPTPNMIDNT